MLETIARIISIKELRTRIGMTALILIIYRMGKFIPTPGIDFDAVSNFMKDMTSQGDAVGNMLSMADMFTGGAMSSGAIFGLGIMPYITASIIFQMLVAIVPSLSRLSHEGASGRKKINQYTRLATVVLTLFYGFMLCGQLYGLSAGSGGEGTRFVSANVTKAEFYFYGMLSLTVGTCFVMWLGEQIDEFGIGNGFSLLIMIGIIARLPGSFLSMIGQLNQQGGVTPWQVAIVLLLFVLMTVAVVMITLGTRRVTVQQPKATRGRRVYGGQRQFLPLRVNQSGVIPIIFAQSIMYLPVFILPFFDRLTGIQTAHFFSHGAFWYTVMYVILIMFFCYFYTAITFNPTEMADNLKQGGMFLPGIRPGKRTAEYLEKVMTRIALAGSIFLSGIAILPDFIASGLGIDPQIAAMLGGTALLIVVGVALDVVQRVEGHLLARDYEGFGIAGGKVKGRR